MDNDPQVQEAEPHHSTTKPSCIEDKTSFSSESENHVSAAREQEGKESHKFNDPVLAAAAVGAAAKRAKRPRRKPRPPPELPFQIRIDNEWKVSLHRFARTAASTARTMASMAEPVLVDVVRTATTPLNVPTIKQDKGSSTVEKETDSQREQSVHSNSLPPSHSINQSEGFVSTWPHTQYSATETNKSFQQSNEGKASLGQENENAHNNQGLKEIQPKTPILRRKYTEAPAVMTPEVFGGCHSSAYSFKNLSEPLPVGAQSPISINVKEQVEPDITCREREKADCSRSGLTSAASLQTAANDSSRLPASSGKTQQNIFASPKQFVELVTKRLLEQRPKEEPRHNQLWNERTQIHSSYGTTGISQQWNGDSGMSPPGSPSASVVSMEMLDKKEVHLDSVTLWDMVPIVNDETRSLISDVLPEELGTPMPPPRLKQVVLLDPSPSCFMQRISSKKNFRKNEDFSSNNQLPQKRHNADKDLQQISVDEKADSSSFHVGSPSVGSLKESIRNHRSVQRRRKFYRSKSPTFSCKPGGSCQSSHNSSSSILTLNSDNSENEVSGRSRVMSQANASGLFAEADINSSSPLEDEDEMLNEALMAFSTMKNMSLANKFPKLKLPDDLEYVASIRWRQLLANWKHNEMMRVMTCSPSSLHFTSKRFHNIDPTIEWSSLASTTTIEWYRRKHEDVLSDRPMISASTSNLNGLIPNYPFELQNLSSFITHIGSQSHNVSSSNEKEKQKVLVKHNVSNDATVEDLLRLAAEKHKQFSILIRQLVIFASQDNRHEQSDDYETQYLQSSVDIKDAKAIRAKADKKYKGDLLQVKDVLRAQIVFPTEGALICAFALLNQYCSFTSSTTKVNNIVEEVGIKVEIVRIKNLFAMPPSSQSCAQLPTGYKHLLITLRLNDSIVAGK